MIEENKEILEPLFISNSGVILLNPFLGILFEKCGLTNKNEFISEQFRFKAVHLLNYAVTGNSDFEENNCVLSKLLCGIPYADPIVEKIILSNEDKEIVNSLLHAITKQWRPLNGTSIDGLRESFLQREGKLEEDEEQYKLTVEHKAFDMLLDQIPWTISIIKFSWMKKCISIKWR